MRPWLVWVVFAACLAVLLAGMGWASATVLHLDRAQTAAQQQAVLEENIRLALWRMDSALAPLIARESTWPYFAYAPFYPAQRAYTNMLMPVQEGEILMPSPLLSQPSEQVLLHFQIEPGNRFSSPQVPIGTVRKLAEKGYTTAEAITTAAGRLDRLQKALSHEMLQARLEAPAPSNGRVAVLPPANQQRVSPSPRQAAPAPQVEMQQAAAPQPQALEPQYDLTQRQQRQQQFVEMQQQAPPAQKGKGSGEYSARSSSIANNAITLNEQQILGAPWSDVQEGISQPLWIHDHLLLARRVAVNGGEYIQGCWMDWPAIERSLVDQIKDLLPEGRLEPITPSQPTEMHERILAALPVRLIPGALPVGMARASSPVWLSLAVAWGCMLLAAAAVALLLHGALSLSERRGAFVSAVTHEMRTPLTTFRMYTEMLVKGMVPEERRVRYLDTLRMEADRLAHLVENVLAYARLERGQTASRMEPITAAAILERSAGRLADRAEQAGMRLTIDSEAARDARVQADPTAVEQILFNLVDNACKYATDSTEKIIHLRVEQIAGAVAFEVADDGPGVSAEQRRRLFRPFSKSAQQAAHSAPGVGLGLALSRRLARKMRGDLTYDHNRTEGATFRLTLPRWDSQSR